MENWIVAENIIAAAAIITAITILIVAFRKTSKFIKKTVHFFDDYFGEEERPGVERRAGVSERLSKMESCLSNVDLRFKTIEYKIENIEKELQPNSGTSLRDAINRIEDRVETLESGG
jgi:archaellum component FlaC